MAVVAQKSVASLMRKTLDRQAALARLKFSLNRDQVSQVLRNYVKDGNSGSYNELMRVLKDGPLNDNNFRVLLEDSMNCVVLLGKDLKQFVDFLCDVEWINRTEDLVELYKRFLFNLVTAHAYHCQRIMNSLMKLFKGKINLKYFISHIRKAIYSLTYLHSL